MTSPEFVSGLSLPLDRLAEGFADCFSGYLVPVAGDARSFEQRLRTEHVHLADSLLMAEGGRVVAMTLIARRGERSRVAAMGIVAERRRGGLGRVLLERALEQARQRGERSLVLEVFESNAPAVALYTRLGFEVRRRLVGWEGVPEARPGLVEEVPLVSALGAVLREGEPELPWQLAPETLAGLTAPTRAFRLGDAVAVLTEAGPEDLVLRSLVVPQARRRRGEGRRLVQALAAHFPGRRWKVPPIVPETLGAGFFPALGLRRQALTQLEMMRAP